MTFQIVLSDQGVEITDCTNL